MAIGGILAGAVMVLIFVGAGMSASNDTTPASTPAAPPPPAVVESGPAPKWEGARRAGWAHDGSKTIAFTLAATRDLPVWMNKARPALIVRCQYRATEVFVALDTSAGFEEDANLRTVRVQWDNDQQGVQQWTVSESGKELFAPDGIAFVRRMTHAQRLQFGFTPFNAPPVMADFVVQGFEELAGLVARTCSWRLDEPTRTS